MKNKAKVHDIVQINDNHDWFGTIVYVTETKPFGIVGFLNIPMKGKAYIRLKENQYEVVGSAKIKLE